MTDRERLIELVRKGIQEFGKSTAECSADEYIADHLLANGVIAQKQGEWKIHQNDGITEMTTMTVNECPHKFVNKADVVEVVRCEDCSHKHDMIGHSYRYCAMHNMKVYADDFCSYGEKMDGNGSTVQTKIDK